MPSWISKATTLLGGRRREPELPEPYGIACGCGNSVEGLRQPKAQMARCNRCGEQLFVLPKDAYPRPKPPKPAKPGAGSSTKLEPKEKPAAPPDDDESPAARTAAGFRRTTEAAKKAPPKPEERAPKVPLRERTRQHMRRAMERQRALFTPFRLLILAIFGVVFLTGYWGVKMRRADHAAAIVQGVTNEADAALAEGNFVLAAKKYREAWDAHEILGRGDAEANRVHQAYRETTAASRLSAWSLYDIVTDAQKARQAGEAGWETTLDARYRDLWLVIDSTVQRNVGADGVSRTHIDCPLMIDEATLVIETDGKVFDALVSGGESHRAVFAAQLAGFRFDETGEPRWIVSLKAGSVFPWSNWETYRQLGMAGGGPEAETESRRILAEQSERLGIEVSP